MYYGKQRQALATIQNLTNQVKCGIFGTSENQETRFAAPDHFNTVEMLLNFKTSLVANRLLSLRSAEASIVDIADPADVMLLSHLQSIQSAIICDQPELIRKEVATSIKILTNKKEQRNPDSE